MEKQVIKLIRFQGLVECNIVKNRVTLQRWINSNGFPKPVRLGPNTVAWKASEVQAWIEGRAGEGLVAAKKSREKINGRG